jgi:hypothetical protein
MWRRAAIGCLLALLSSAACGDTRLIGRSCPETGCQQQTVPLAACWMHLAMPIVEVANGGAGLEALSAKYDPYRDEPPPGPLLALRPERYLWWRAADPEGRGARTGGRGG